MAAINGALANIPIIDTTDNVNYLSVAMGGWVKDFADSPNGDWIDGYHPYVSDLGLNLSQGALTRNLFVPTLSTTTAGHIAKSYLYDFYFRIHLNIYELLLGNILSEQVRYVEIWNSNFISTDLTSVSNVGLTDLVINYASTSYDPGTTITTYTPITIPHTFTALSWIRSDINVPALGVPTINGYYTFNFAGTNSPILDVIGQRVVLWPFNTINTYKETRAYLTDVIPCRTTEQRFTLREIPRMSLEYTYRFLTNNEFVQAKNLAKTIANLPIAVPVWAESVKLLDLTAVQSTFYFNTANLELSVGMPILFWKNTSTWEIQEIFLVYSDRIVLKQGLNFSYTHAWAIPIAIGYTTSGINLKTDEGGIDTGTLQITATDVYTSPAWTYTSFQSLPVWDTHAILTGGIPNNYSRENSIGDTPTGLYTYVDEELYNREVTKITIIIKNQADLYTMKRRFDYIKGKYLAFWLPSFVHDFTPITAITSGVATLKVSFANLANYPAANIFVLGKRYGTEIYECFNITATVNNGDGTETMSFAIAATKTFDSITSVSILTKVRLDSDNIEYEHLGKKHVRINVPVKEVLA